MNVYYDETAMRDIDRAMPMYAKKNFKSPHRSTVPLLSWLKHEQPMLGSLLRDIGMPANCTLHLEYEVMPPIGKGSASHTDLMAISGKSSLAVEAKWSEPRYETVGEWLRKGSNPSNLRDVLTGWLGLLQEHAVRELHLADFSDAVYQMVHRAASACMVGSDPRMAYIVFEPSPDPDPMRIPDLRDDLTHLWSLLGDPKGFPFYLVEVRLSPTAAFNEIASMPKGHIATARSVIAALSGTSRLFSFEKYHVTKIGG